MPVRCRLASLVVLACFPLLTAPVVAQELAPPRLDTLVHAGSVVKIKTTGGQVVHGTVSSVSASSLTFEGRSERIVLLKDIDTVWARVGKRPILLGTLIGAGTGAALILLSDTTADNPPCTPQEWFCGAQFGPSDTLVGAITIAVGAAAGAGVGALLPRRMQVVYRAPVTSSITVAPLLTGGRIGVVVSVPF